MARAAPIQELARPSPLELDAFASPQRYSDKEWPGLLDEAQLSRFMATWNLPIVDLAQDQ
jgi:hypothetical protein